MIWIRGEGMSSIHTQMGCTEISQCFSHICVHTKWMASKIDLSWLNFNNPQKVCIQK